ncbi:hypothetical protein NPX13_g3646 [Xylaria arbuscula]|uniref:Uncharacterized protein n=1 Tax=Xylaria arbuscula TaxID=114810 RepID=A0A9W8TN12_9PEZI|nr:hypothetical protein NPX13_g3646 [Xylaria arbuscula]
MAPQREVCPIALQRFVNEITTAQNERIIQINEARMTIILMVRGILEAKLNELLEQKNSEARPNLASLERENREAETLLQKAQEVIALVANIWTPTMPRPNTQNLVIRQATKSVPKTEESSSAN